MSKRKRVTVVELKTAPEGSLLHCDECGSDYSATHGDYSWSHEPEYVFECCGQPMRLVRRVVRYETVRT